MLLFLQIILGSILVVIVIFGFAMSLATVMGRWEEGNADRSRRRREERERARNFEREARDAIVARMVREYQVRQLRPPPRPVQATEEKKPDPPAPAPDQFTRFSKIDTGD